jgi:hypothetical protein
MTENDLINVVVDELLAMACAVENAPSLLRRIQNLYGRKDCKIISVQCFHKAFGGGVAGVSPVAGWCGFGGELSDAEIDSLVAAVLEDYRKRVGCGGKNQIVAKRDRSAG